MSASQETPLDLEVIASLLRPEDLDPLQDYQHQSIEVEDITRITQKADDSTRENVSNEEAMITRQPTDSIKAEEDNGIVIPGLSEFKTSGSDLAAMDVQKSPVHGECSYTAAIETDIGAPPSSEKIGNTALSSILAKHNLQVIASESSDESEDISEESEDSTSQSDSDDSSDSDSDSTSSSGSSEDLPKQKSASEAMNGDAEDSDPSTESSRLKAKHKRNNAKLNKMVRDGEGSEDGFDLPRGTQPLAMFATAHEIIAPQVTMPSITEVPDNEHIELVGEVMSVVDSVVVVKSSSNGMQCVLDTDSLLVLEGRKVLGLVFETFGPLTAPMYSVRFPSSSHFPAALTTFLESPKEHKLKVYYCPSRSTFAYTSKLMLDKGNDASNLYDEEVAEEELEFSDDEAEREWKRLHGKDGAGGKRKRRASSKAGSVYSESSRLGESTILPYDDEMDETLLASGNMQLSYVDPYYDEPANPHEPSTSTSQRPLLPSPNISSHLPPRPNNNSHATNDRTRGRGRGRGRGGQTNFSVERARGRGRGAQPSRERGRQPPQGQYLPGPMGPPLMTGYNNHAEYNPSFAGNISPTAGHVSRPGSMGVGGAMYDNVGGFLGAPYVAGMNFQSPFMGLQSQPSQGYGMSNVPMNMNQGMYGGGGVMPGGAGPGMSPGMGGPSPGAYVNPRFAMMQLLPPGVQPGQTAAPYQHGDGYPNPGQDPPR